MSALRELIERLEGLDGPSREVDVALLPLWDANHEALRSWAPEYQTELRDGGFSAWKDGYSVSAPFPRFTSSVDAAIVLTERVLPGWTIAEIGQQDDKSWYSELRRGYRTSYDKVAISNPAWRDRPPTPALSLLIATLKALATQEEGHE